MTTITNLPAAPEPTDTTAEFNTKAFAWVLAINDWTDEANLVAGEVNTNAATATTKAASSTASASSATASAASATLSASSATTSATSASSSASSTATLYDQFDDRYLGSKSSAPTFDNDGNGLITGALYFNSTTNVMNVYTGSAWSAAYIPVTGYAPIADPQFTGEIKVNGVDVPDQTDIGTDPNQIPLNQFLGTMAYQDLPNVELSLRPIVPLTSPTVQDVIDALIALGLVTQAD
jgi:hypothetical protein